VVETKRKPAGASAGAGAPPAAPGARSGRRLFLTHANDNRPTGLERLLRAALFVAAGSAIAWGLTHLFG
jgi:hypothetical protein